MGLIDPETDLSGTNLDNVDLSNNHLTRVRLTRCSLRNVNFTGTVFESCILDESDWSGADFQGASFFGGSFRRIKNASKAKNLHTVFAGNDQCKFDEAILTIWDRVDWETIRVAGRLPFFGISTSAIAILTTYFYVFSLYNSKIKSAASVARAMGPDMSQFVNAINYLYIPAPKLALETLFAAICLLFASSLYAIFCPDRVKQFTHEAWLYQLKKSLIQYTPHTWRYPPIRVVCALLYAVGGAASIHIIVVKLFWLVKVAQR